MITQYLTDVLCSLIGQLIALLPPLPAGWTSGPNNVIGWMASGGTFVAGIAAKLGPIIPWDVLTTVMNVWMGLLVFWVVMAGGRIILWALGR
jgi:hypothetical protein